MDKIILDLSNEKIENLLEKYEMDLKNIYKSLKNENLIDLIDIIDLKSFKIENKIKEDLYKDNLIEFIKKEEYGLFLMLGGICDENVTYFRFINGIQYRIAEGECYEESSENFHDYKCEEKLINTGDMKFSIECSYGLALYIKNGKLNLDMVELIEDDYNVYNAKIVDKSGEFGMLIKEYINDIIS